MPKIAATFDDQQQADAVVSALGKLELDGLDWRVDQAGDGSRGGGTVLGVPASMAGNGVRAADSGPAVLPPFFGRGADGVDAGGGDEEDYLSQARTRGATVIVVTVPAGSEDIVQDILQRHSASNLTVS
jgi:hypothetical protein